MAYRKYKSDQVLSEADRIIRIWQENPDFTLGKVTMSDFQAMMDALTQHEDHLRSLRGQLVGALDQRDDTARALNQLVVRARSGVRGYFGPDSTEYEIAGGTRTSERKPRRRKAKPANEDNLSA